MKRNRVPGIFVILLAILLPGCGRASPQPTPTPPALPTQPPIAAPTLTPLPTVEPTPTTPPFYLPALVYPAEPRVPILLYHRFQLNPDIESNYKRLQLSEFRAQLEALYNAGFSLIPLENWLKGDLHVPPGRRPLILTMDDLFFADQIYLEPDGTPSLRSGIGILWQFSQQYPDFGFSIALFFNMGDKLFGNTPVDMAPYYINTPGWEDSLANVIAWCIEHGAKPYNHLYTHPQLDITSAEGILGELATNDQVLRDYLERIGRQDLIPRLGNIISLPYSIWPASDGGKAVLYNYKNPEGKPVEAILEASYDTTYAQLFSAPGLTGFDPMRVPRFSDIDPQMRFLQGWLDQIPAAAQCQLGPLDEQQSKDPAYLSQQIQAAVQNGACPAGFYTIDGLLFNAQNGTVSQLNP